MHSFEKRTFLRDTDISKLTIKLGCPEQLFQIKKNFEPRIELQSVLSQLTVQQHFNFNATKEIQLTKCTKTICLLFLLRNHAKMILIR